MAYLNFKIASKFEKNKGEIVSKGVSTPLQVYNEMNNLISELKYTFVFQILPSILLLCGSICKH